MCFLNKFWEISEIIKITINILKHFEKKKEEYCCETIQYYHVVQQNFEVFEKKEIKRCTKSIRGKFVTTQSSDFKLFIYK